MRANLRLIPAWNQGFEIPDVIAFRDFEACGREFVTDVHRRLDQYYPDRLIQFPYPKSEKDIRGCDPSAVALILRIHGQWHTWQSIQGLPIGPEVSPAVANAFLLPVDERLSVMGLPYLRWMDDLWIFGTDVGIFDRVLQPLDDELSGLRLVRSVEKTLLFDDVDHAVEEIRSSEVTSLGIILRMDPRQGLEEVAATV